MGRDLVKSGSKLDYSDFSWRNPLSERGHFGTFFPSSRRVLVFLAGEIPPRKMQFFAHYSPSSCLPFLFMTYLRQRETANFASSRKIHFSKTPLSCARRLLSCHFLRRGREVVFKRKVLRSRPFFARRRSWGIRKKLQGGQIKTPPIRAGE